MRSLFGLVWINLVPYSLFVHVAPCERSKFLLVPDSLSFARPAIISVQRFSLQHICSLLILNSKMTETSQMRSNSKRKTTETSDSRCRGKSKKHMDRR